MPTSITMRPVPRPPSLSGVSRSSAPVLRVASAMAPPTILNVAHASDTPTRVHLRMCPAPARVWPRALCVPSDTLTSLVSRPCTCSWPICSILLDAWSPAWTTFVASHTPLRRMVPAALLWYAAPSLAGRASGGGGLDWPNSARIASTLSASPSRGYILSMKTSSIVCGKRNAYPLGVSLTSIAPSGCRCKSSSPTRTLRPAPVFSKCSTSLVTRSVLDSAPSAKLSAKTSHKICTSAASVGSCSAVLELMSASPRAQLGADPGLGWMWPAFLPILATCGSR
mmetsp:Transcript_63752/g.179458  ORF Transcript_63752/g.179458 Transcript_63752/m.179458 type:complete len:282 (+) Transcript_63752:836-1681(+)